MELLEQIGLTKEELQTRVVNTIAEKLLTAQFEGYDSEEYPKETELHTRLEELIQARVDAKITELAEKHVLPNVAQQVETLVLQKTNQWGEKVGQPVTFIEYLTQRAEAYMLEEVDYDGKAQHQCNSYSWRREGTRIAHLINRHLDHSIKIAMENALKIATSSIAKGIEETAKIQLEQVAEKLRVEVQTR